MGIRYFVWLRLRNISVRTLYNYNLSSNIMNRKNLSKIQILDLAHCRECTDSIIFQITKICHNLTSLDLSECNELTDNSINSISLNCPNLTHLNIQGCTNVTDRSIDALCSRCLHITSFDFSKCYQLTDVSVLNITKAYPNLKLINPSSCFRITDVSIIALTERCKSIETLQLSWCLKLRDDSFLILTKAYGHQLKHLMVSWSNRLTNFGVDSIANNCPVLMSLDLSFCKEVNCDSTVYSVMQSCLKLLVYNLHGCRSISMYTRNYIGAMIEDRRSKASPADVIEADRFNIDFTNDYR